MQRESVLEFMLKDELYCFNTTIIEYVFELEDYEKLEGISPTIKGIARHNSEAIPLIDTLQLFSVESSLNMNTDKSVIVISEEGGGRYGMLVDEIIQIEELEIAPVSVDLSSEELIINHYKKRDKIINEIVPLPLLHKHTIPSFSKETLTQYKQYSSDKQEYVLCKIEKSLYAIEAIYVDEVIEFEGEFFAQESHKFHGAIAVRNQAIQVAKMGKFEGSDLLIVQKDGATFGIRASEILDIEHIESSQIQEISQESQEKIAGYYNLNEHVIAIVNLEHFLLRKSSVKNHKKQESEHVVDKEAHLIFTIDNREFALDMSHIRQVIQVEEVAKTKSSALGLENSTIEFIMQYNHKGVDVIKLDRALDLNTMDDGEIILIEYEKKVRGILIDFIDDIYYAEPKDVTRASSDTLLLHGALFKEEKVVAILNPKKIMEII